MTDYLPLAPLVDVPAAVRALGIAAQRRGSELWARCPFPGHAEKTPSWSIQVKPGREGNGYHKCYGCDSHGGVVELVRELLDLSDWRAAVAWLEERGLVAGKSVPGGLRLVATGGALRGEAGVPHGVRFGPLSEWATPARRYARSRGLTDEQVGRWGLGYGAEGELAARLFLPLRDYSGRLAGWTARAFGGQEPKYRDPGGSRGADRAAVYGEQHWPPPGKRAAATLVLCEGELNALACERAGARYVGALGGSGLDPGQNLRIQQFGRVLVATDVDDAGTKAARDLRAALARWRGVGRVAFPPGADACDVERELGAAALARLLRGAA